MLIPLGTDRPLRRPTGVTLVLIALNVAMVFAQAITGDFDPPPNRAHGWILEHLMLSRTTAPEAWRFVTYAFLHADLWHIGGNMLFLWVFGPNVEDKLGRGWFVLFYLLGAVVAGLAHVASSAAPVLGASGAIAAVTGAYLVLFPLTRIRCLWLFFMIGISWVPAWWFIGFAIAFNLLMGFGGVDTGVAFVAHLGGYGFGMVVSLLILWLHLRERETYDLFMIGRQAYRRRQLRAAAHLHEREMKRRIGAPPARARARVPGGPARSEPDEAMRLRAETVRLIGEDEMDKAAQSYKRLVDAYADTPAMVTLSRKHQSAIAGHLFASGDHDGAAFAYQRFLDANPTDREAPRVRLMLALLSARYLNDPVRASGLLDGLDEDLDDQGELELAQELRSELG